MVDLTKHFLTDEVFESRDAVKNWCQDVGKTHNTVLVISKSTSTIVGKGSRIVIGCERGGIYRDHKNGHKPKTTIKRNRQIGTKKCDCPFKLKGVWLVDNKWTLTILDGRHNHDIPAALTGHAFVSRLKDEANELLIKLTCSGVKPRHILTSLKLNDPSNHSTMMTLYNARQRHRLFEMEGRSAMQQVMKLLAENHYIEWHRSNEETYEVTDILWAHSKCISLAQCFPNVIIVDCTYKTNRWKMPLFHMMGVTSTGKTFTIALAFIRGEVASNFTWALQILKTLYASDKLPPVFVTDRDQALRNAIEEVFPEASKLLCTCHIGKAVVANCRSAFKDNEPLWNKFYKAFDDIWRSEILSEYEDALTAFVETWTPSNPNLVIYVRDTWLIHKECFVVAWTDKIKHYGNTITNRCEGQHGKVKVYLGSFTENFSTCWESTHNMIRNQLVEIKASFEHNLTLVRHTHQLPYFRDIINHISHMALDLLIDELERKKYVGVDIKKYECVLRTSRGLPCAHELVQYMHDCLPIPLTEIDMQWRQLLLVSIEDRTLGFDDQPEVQFLRKR